MSLFSFDSDTHTQSKRGIATAGIIIAALVIIGGGAFAYTQLRGGGDDGANGASGTPTLADITEAHQAVETFQHESTISAQANLNPSALEQREDAQQQRQMLSFVPNVSAQDGFPSTLSAEFMLSGNASVSTTTFAETQSQISLAVGEEEPSEILSVELRRTDGLNYVRAATLPTVGFFDLSQYEGQWFSFEASEAASQSPVSFESSGLPQNLQEDLPEGTSISEETTRDLIAAMQEEDVITFTNSSEVELADGTSAYRLDVSFDPNAVEAYLQQVKEILEESNPELADSEALNISSEEIQQAKESLTQLNDQFDTVRVWIGQETNYLRKVKLASNITASEAQALSQDREVNLQGFEDASITIDVALSSYNEPTEVTAPENATPFSEAFGSQSQGGLQPDTMQPGAMQ